MSDTSPKLVGEGGIDTALTRIPTRQLMQLLKDSRASQWTDVWGGGVYGKSYDIEDIRAELRHREHVPNKLEARASRRKHQNGGVQHQKKAVRMRFSKHDTVKP